MSAYRPRASGRAARPGVAGGYDSPPRVPAAPRARPRLIEKAFNQEMVDLATLFGWTVWRDNATNARATCTRCGEVVRRPRNAPGYPDLSMLRLGPTRHLYAECKRDAKTKPSPGQVFWLWLLSQQAGTEVYVFHPSLHAEIVNTLADAERTPRCAPFDWRAVDLAKLARDLQKDPATHAYLATLAAFLPSSRGVVREHLF